ncbi:Sec62/63 complex, subunit Sec66 [Tricharina praecox]|uniref:Sec62/63 complex, subunit Sec66 n=1 Tax=Tricharina praecox TaxID=43433 RepID=UPI00221FEC30|nr:Sec62/63 complex, subunit Sec66 [Tricharina praecox]KAI5844247.1 Sec62/63 complex, subunit Sec66 [Tricharina praecox]
MVNLISLIAPVSYIAVLLGSLIAFSSLYRKRKNAKAASLEPWFPPHTARDVYLSLLHQDEESSVPDTLLKAALMLRAKEDIRRLMVLRTSKGSLQGLLQKGCVGDDLWTRFSRAESEMEEELRDVVMEANAYKEGWGQLIFQTANEMVNHDRIKERAEKVATEAEAERKWWNEKRERSSRELMGEEEEFTSDDNANDSDGVGEKVRKRRVVKQ